MALPTAISKEKPVGRSNVQPGHLDPGSHHHDWGGEEEGGGDVCVRWHLPIDGVIRYETALRSHFRPLRSHRCSCCPRGRPCCMSGAVSSTPRLKNAGFAEELLGAIVDVVRRIL